MVYSVTDKWPFSLFYIYSSFSFLNLKKGHLKTKKKKKRKERTGQKDLRVVCLSCISLLITVFSTHAM